MSTKKKPKKRPMRLWLVRDVDPYTDVGGDVWWCQSQSVPWLYRVNPSECWFPRGKWLGRDLSDYMLVQFDLAPGECVELREVHDEACHKKEVR